MWHSIEKRKLVQSLEPFLGLRFCSLRVSGEKKPLFCLILAPLLVASSEGCEVRREHLPFWLPILYIFMPFVVKANGAVCCPRPWVWVTEVCHFHGRSKFGLAVLLVMWNYQLLVLSDQQILEDWLAQIFGNHL